MVTTGGTLAFNRSDALTVSNLISGTGAVTQIGAGTTSLTGANTYSGGTTISGGVLQLGDGGTSGSIIGPVLNNGALVINRSDAYTFAGVISGSGMFVQDGTGTTTLTGANTYAGGTLISRGRLVGNTTSLRGVIQNDAALEFAQNVAGDFTGQLFGAGLFDKTGAGLLTLTGNSSGFTGGTFVRAGELRVNGLLSNSRVTVLSGATLSGNGTVGGLIARSGSVVSPGAGGLGMLGVNGAIGANEVGNVGQTLRRGWDAQLSWQANEQWRAWGSYSRQKAVITVADPSAPQTRGRQIERHLRQLDELLGRAARAVQLVGHTLGQADVGGVGVLVIHGLGRLSLLDGLCGHASCCSWRVQRARSPPGTPSKGRPAARASSPGWGKAPQATQGANILIRSTCARSERCATGHMRGGTSA